MNFMQLLFKKSTSIATKWPNISVTDTQGEASFWIGQIISFIKHDIVSSLNISTTKVHILVLVQSYGDHLLRHYNINSSVVVCFTVFDH